MMRRAIFAAAVAGITWHGLVAGVLVAHTDWGWWLALTWTHLAGFGALVAGASVVALALLAERVRAQEVA
jgi:hypothetical protein